MKYTCFFHKVCYKLIKKRGSKRQGVFMSVKTIIAIITAGIALITSVTSFTYNFIQNRKERIQKVILDN